MVTKTVIRYFAAAVSAVVAVVYFFIAIGVIKVVYAAPESSDWFIPGSAAAAFAVVAALLIARRSRFIAALGVFISVFAIAGYFTVSPQRTPSYETWGILIKLAQGILVITLGYLALARVDAVAGRRQVT